MNYYITWDMTGEHFWKATPYYNVKTHKWETEHDTPDNKVKLCDNTVERYCWEAINVAYPINIHKLTNKEARGIKKFYETT